jgi:histidinol-phosphatase (PHP family)
MILEDWHTHNVGCKHATGTIEEYIRAAIEFKLQTIGISDHFPYELLEDIERIPYGEYAIKVPEIEKYLKTTEIIKKNICKRNMFM